MLERDEHKFDYSNLQVKNYRINNIHLLRCATLLKLMMFNLCQILSSCLNNVSFVLILSKLLGSNFNLHSDMLLLMSIARHKRQQHYLNLRAYSKTCVKRPLKNRQSKDLNDKWKLIEGQTHCRMLHLMHVLQYF